MVRFLPLSLLQESYRGKNGSFEWAEIKEPPQNSTHSIEGNLYCKE